MNGSPRKPPDQATRRTVTPTRGRRSHAAHHKSNGGEICICMLCVGLAFTYRALYNNISRTIYLPQHPWLRSSPTTRCISIPRSAPRLSTKGQRARGVASLITTKSLCKLAQLNLEMHVQLPTVYHKTVSRTFNFLFKVLFIFPSRYLFAIGLKVVFSLVWSLPHDLSCITKQLDSPKWHLDGTLRSIQACHPLWVKSPNQKDLERGYPLDNHIETLHSVIV